MSGGLTQFRCLAEMLLQPNNRPTRTLRHLMRNVFLTEVANTKSLMIEAYGVMPIPPPTSTETS